MTAAALVAAGRAAHAQLMVDTCVIEHPDQAGFNTATGEYTTTWTTVYAGPCRVKGPTAGDINVSQAQAGEAEQTTTRQTLVLPYAATASAAAGDLVTVNRVGSPELLFRVVGAVDATTMTAQAFVIERAEAGGAFYVDGGAPHFPSGDIVDGGTP